VETRKTRFMTKPFKIGRQSAVASHML